MTPKYIRWRCERVDALLAIGISRLELLSVIRHEEQGKPWERDPRPAPLPLPMGDAYHGLSLLQQLEGKGYGVVELVVHGIKQETQG